MAKKFFYFFILWAYIVGVIGGIGYALSARAYFIAVCIVVLGAMAFPTAKKAYTNLVGND